MTRSRLLAALCAFLLASPAELLLCGQVADVVAVVGSKGDAYSEAVDGLKSVIPDVDVATVSDIPSLKNAKVIVTFGAEAAQQSYPGNLPQVAALLSDPNFEIDHSGNVTKVGLTPAAAFMAAKFKNLAPKISTLAVVDVKGAYSDYFSALKAAAAADGYHVVVKKVASVSGLMQDLPDLKGAVQGFYIPPDPLFINGKVLGVLTGFCNDAGIALFLPVLGLEKMGAYASVAPSFKEIGRTAGLAAQSYLQGETPGDWVYSVKAESQLNNAVADGMRLSK